MSLDPVSRGDRGKFLEFLLYYDVFSGALKDKEIADLLGVGAYTLSRWLSKARDARLIQRVDWTAMPDWADSWSENPPLPEISRALLDRFGSHGLRIAIVFRQPATDDEAQCRALLGRGAALWIDATLQRLFGGKAAGSAAAGADGTGSNVAGAGAADHEAGLAPAGEGVVGVAWGRTVSCTTDGLKPTQQLKNLRFVPLLGGRTPAVGEAGGTFDVGVLRTLQQKYGGKRTTVDLPAYLPPANHGSEAAPAPELVARYLGDLYRPSLEYWKRLDVAIVGIGSLQQDAWLLRSGAFDAEQATALRQRGAVASLCLRTFRSQEPGEGGAAFREYFLERSQDQWLAEEGESNNLIAIPLQTLEETARSKRVIAVARTSEAEPKHEAIRHAVEAGLVSDLVTDEATAARLLE